jgi:hypothetical protein
MSTPTFEFEKWDYELILSFKRYITNANDLEMAKKIWAERCALDLKNFDPTMFIVERLSRIVFYLYSKTGSPDYSPMRILTDNSPEKDYWYELSTGRRNTTNEYYWARIFQVYANILTQVNCSLIEGLNEYFENEWIKSGKP